MTVKTMHLFIGSRTACGKPITTVRCTRDVMQVSCLTCLKSTAYTMAARSLIPPEHPAHTQLDDEGS